MVKLKNWCIFACMNTFKYKNINNLEEFKQDYENLTINEIVNKYKLNNKTIWSYAQKLKINRPVGSKRINKVNDFYFSSLNECANKYYILGLIFTDGNLPIKNKNSFIISNIDLELLEKIKLELNFSGKITTEHNKKYNKYIYKLQITSPQIRKDLESFGLIPNKTMSLKFPNIPEKYLKDFIRGLWDGDGGAINPLSKQKKQLLVSYFVCASYEFMLNLLKVLPVKNKTIKTQKRNTNLYSINLRGFDSLILKDFMYYDECLCMQRKRNIFFNYKPRRSTTIIHYPEKDKGIV